MHVRRARIAGPQCVWPADGLAVAEQLDDRVAASEQRHVDLGVRKFRLGGDLLSLKMVASDLAQAEVLTVERNRALEIADRKSVMVDFIRHLTITLWRR